MSQDDFLDDRRRASEDDYFRKKDRELIEKMRQAAAADRAKTELSTRTGLSDPALIAELGALGFTPDTISVLPLVPVVQMAWAEGGITPAERDMLIRLARGRGIAAGGAADQQLSDWMARRPSDDVFARAMRLIRAMLDTGTAVDGSLNADDVIKYSESIAAASGGLFGIGKISAEERETLGQIVSALKARLSPARVLSQRDNLWPVERCQSRRCRGISAIQRPSFADRSTYSRAAARSPR